MSWFNASQFSSFAKQALSQAQKSIDRVLDIQAEEEEEGEGGTARSRPGEAGRWGRPRPSPRRGAQTAVLRRAAEFPSRSTPRVLSCAGWRLLPPSLLFPFPLVLLSSLSVAQQDPCGP